MSKSGRTPTLQQLLDALKRLDSWFVFGTWLGVPFGQLKKIESFHQKEPDRCKLDMLQYWLDNKLFPVWNEVILALEKTDQLVLAAQIKHEYLLSSEDEESISSTTSPSTTPTLPTPPTHSYASSTTSLTTDEIKANIKADVAVVSNLKELEASFGHMLVQVKRLLVNSKCDLSDALLFLDSFIGSEVYIKCDNFDNLMRQLQRDHISVFNISILQQLLGCFNNHELTQVIEAYSEKKDSFLKQTTVLEFQRAVVSRVEPIIARGKAVVTITISKEMASQRTLMDIENLAIEGFKECHKEFIDLHAEPGSIIISWVFPKELSGRLEQLAHDNAAIFEENGVVEVTVGERRVFPCTQQEDIMASLGVDEKEKSKLKQLYTKFYQQLVEAVSDPDTCHSLTTQLHSTSLLSEEKKAALSSSQASGSSYLKVLGVEEKPQLVTVLMKKMSAVKQLQRLAEDMTTWLSGSKQAADTHFTEEQELHYERKVRQQLETDNERLTSDKTDLLSRLQCYEEDIKTANKLLTMKEKAISGMMAAADRKTIDKDESIIHLTKTDAAASLDTTVEETQCVCQMFCQEVGLNSWKVVFTFIPSVDNLEQVRMLYKGFDAYGSPFDCCLESSGSDKIEVKALNKIDRWDMECNIQVNRAAVEQYTGEGEPPYCEMTLRATDTYKITPPDLIVEAKLKGVQKPNIIKFEKEAQNVVECVCQVFYHKVALNHWRARVAFFPKQQLQKVNPLYQDANNCSPFDVKFGGGVIKVSTDGTVIPAGWEVIISQQYQQVTTAAVEQYTGEGEPPYCEMTLRATDSDKSALTILQLPVTLIGVRQPNNIFNIERALVTPDGTPLYTPQPSVASKDIKCTCQVFYHKKGINHWKATLAFFPISKTDRVKQFYQDANLGPTIDLHFEVSRLTTASFTLRFVANKDKSWSSEQLNSKVTKRDILSYTGEGKPPIREVTFRSISIRDTPPDLNVTMVLHGLRSTANKLQIERKAEDSLGPPDCMCQVYYHRIKSNCWRIVFSFFPNNHLDKVELLYQDCERGPSMEQLLLQHKMVEITCPKSIVGWTVRDKKLSVTRAAVEQYTGEGKPPYCEMTVKATGVKEQHGDLRFYTALKGMETSPIMIEQPYEQSRLELVIEMREKVQEYVYQVFCHEDGTNQWRFVFAFVESKYLDAARQFYTCVRYIEYGLATSFKWKYDDHIEVTAPAQTGWINSWGQHSNMVTTAAVEQYTGEGEPPYCEMTFSNGNPKITPPDLHIVATIRGTKNSVTIKIKKEAQNVIECVCQVFYHKLGFPNHWRATFSFFPKVHEKKVNEFYQDANNCSPFDVKFGGGVITVSTDGTVIPAVWEVIINQQYQQVTTAAVEQYTGEGEPPYCEMTLRATDSAESHSIKQLVTLIGIREQPRNTFYVERVLEKSDGTPLCDFAKNLDNLNNPIVCQVFYHKEGTNHWKATLAFFTKNKMDRVKQFYQDANLGPTLEDVQFTLIIGKLTINPSIKEVSSGWNVPRKVLQKIIKRDVVAYGGMGKPPHREVIFKADDNSTPPDLTVTISFPNPTFTISRVAEASSEDSGENNQITMGDNPSTSRN